MLLLKYLRPFTKVQDQNMENKAFASENKAFASENKASTSENKASTSEKASEILYEDLLPDEEMRGHPVYLTDGVWIYPDDSTGSY